MRRSGSAEAAPCASAADARHEREADGDDGEPPGARTPGHGSGNGDVLLLHDEPPASNLCPGPCGQTGASDGDGLVHVRGQSTRRAMPEAQQTWRFTRVRASAASGASRIRDDARRPGRQLATARAGARGRLYAGSKTSKQAAGTPGKASFLSRVSEAFGSARSSERLLQSPAARRGAMRLGSTSRWRLGPGLLVLATCAGSVRADNGPRVPTFSVGVEIVSLNLVVTDEGGRSVPGLRTDDIAGSMSDRT